MTLSTMLDANGVNLLVWGAPGITNGHFKIPREITVDSNGNLFIVDSGNNRIQKFGSTNSDDKITIQTKQTEEIEVETEQTQVTSEITLASPIVGDFTKPNIIPPNDITVEATAVLTPISIGQASATDESGIKSIESNAPSKFPLGITTIVWTAIDGSGNIAIETQTINVIDLAPPTITAPADVISEATSITENYVDLGNPTTSDNVGIMSITNDAPLVFPLGETIVTWTATDIAGNLENAVQRVIIEDNTKPKIFASDDIILEASSIDQNEVNLGDPEVFDNGIIESITNDAPQFLSLGNTTVTWIAADSAGNIAITTQLITIVDTTAPSILAPEDIVLEATSPIENLDYLGEPTISDVQQVTITNDAPSMVSLGKTIVTWIALDPNGNYASDIQTITVVDTTAPVLQVPEDLVIEAVSIDGNIVVLGEATAVDATGISSIVNDAPHVFPFGTTTVTWTATDINTNAFSATQTVTIVDTTPPELNPPNDIVTEAVDIESNYVEIGEPTIYDAIGIESVSSDALDVFPIGLTTITWTAVDSSGNVVNAFQTVIINDTTKPSITPPLDVIAEADGQDGSQLLIGDAIVTDVIGVAGVTNDSPEIFPIGETTITWTAVDTHGNIAEATQIVTIVDTTPPSIIPPNDIIFEAVNPLENIIFIGELTSDDFVGVSSVTNNAPQVFPLGETIVTWTATDDSGNSANTSQIITVVDTTPPTVTAPEDVILEAANESENLVNYGEAIMDDLVEIVSISNDAPDVFPLGLTTITWTVTDSSGNTSTDTQMISIADSTPPILSVPEDIISEAISSDGALIDIGEATATDSILVASISNNAPEIFPLGETMVTWVATDSSGNEIAETQKISVVDTTAPIIIAPEDITIEAISLTENIVELSIANVEDLVSGVTIINDATDVFAFGEIVVTWIATDASGNSASATQLITVIDTTAPNLLVPEDVVFDATAPETSLSYGVATALDMTDPSPEITNNAPELFPLGETIVTWTTTDKYGNSVSETQSINVQGCGQSISYYNQILGTAEDDTILGTNLPDLIFGLGGDDIIFGYKGNDCILGGEGDDIIFGNEGNDSISGGEGNDIIKGQSGQDKITGDDGTDVIDGGDDYDQCNDLETSSSDIVIKCEI